MKRPEIIGVTLLSTDEAKALPEQMRKSSGDWWLRSPGLYYDDAAFVGGEDGYVYAAGHHVYTPFGVRPVLQISGLETSGIPIGEESFEFGDYNFTVISDKYALCGDIIGECSFRKDWKTEDTNLYEASDIKKFVDEWF